MGQTQVPGAAGLPRRPLLVPWEQWRLYSTYPQEMRSNGADGLRATLSEDSYLSPSSLGRWGGESRDHPLAYDQIHFQDMPLYGGTTAPCAHFAHACLQGGTLYVFDSLDWSPSTDLLHLITTALRSWYERWNRGVPPYGLPTAMERVRPQPPRPLQLDSWSCGSWLLRSVMVSTIAGPPPPLAGPLPATGYALPSRSPVWPPA